MRDTVADRRALLHWLLASPLTGLVAGWPGLAGARPELAVPERAAQALDVFQLKAVAREALDLPTWHFIQNGADDGQTMAANRSALTTDTVFGARNTNTSGPTRPTVSVSRASPRNLRAIWLSASSP